MNYDDMPAGESCEPRPEDVVNCDAEVWIKNQVLTAIRMALALKQQRRVCADDDAYESGLEGVANGVAVEIVHILGKTPGFVNLRKVPRVSTAYTGAQMSELVGLRP